MPSVTAARGRLSFVARPSAQNGHPKTHLCGAECQHSTRTLMSIASRLLLAGLGQLGAMAGGQICGGTLSPSLTHWQLAEDASGLAVVIDAVRCDFPSRPRYFATVVGAEPSWRVSSVRGLRWIVDRAPPRLERPHLWRPRRPLWWRRTAAQLTMARPAVTRR